MKITIKREHGTEGHTFGTLFIDGKLACFTLEDQERDEKIPGETAIPCGIYPVEVTFSPHFGKPLPLLVGVPGFEGVRIHTGNVAEDTEGCVLVGTSPDHDRAFLSGSRDAFSRLFPEIQDAISAGDTVELEIV